MNIFFYLADPWLTPLGTPGHPWVPTEYSHLGTLEANFFVSWAILKISKPTTLSGEFIVFFDQVDPLHTPGHLWAPLGTYRIPPWGMPIQVS